MSQDNDQANEKSVVGSNTQSNTQKNNHKTLWIVGIIGVVLVSLVLISSYNSRQAQLRAAEAQRIQYQLQLEAAREDRAAAEAEQKAAEAQANAGFWSAVIGGAATVLWLL